MGSAYWRVEFIRPTEPDDHRCVLLHGQLDETVGPMTIEMAQAWIDQFDNRPREPSAQADNQSPAAPAPDMRMSRVEPTT